MQSNSWETWLAASESEDPGSNETSGAVWLNHSMQPQNPRWLPISLSLWNETINISDPYGDVETLDFLGSNVTKNITDNTTENCTSGYTEAHIIIASILVTALMIIIVAGNALVVIAIAVDRNLKGLQNWFIASLAVADLLVGLLIMPLSLTNELLGYWIFGNVLCELWLATDVLLCTASILNLCVISLDRYWSITRAVSYVRTRTKKRAIIMIATVWILSMIICLPPLVGWKRPQPTKCGRPLCVLSEDIGYIVYSTLGSFYIPLIVMVVVYFKIYLAARSRARRNLKKPAPITQNGKSVSVTPSTTTSLGTKKDSHHVDEMRDIDEDEPSSYEVNAQPVPAKIIAEQCIKHDYKLQVPNPHIQYKPLDEKFTDTDSACDSPVRNAMRRSVGKHLTFSETDGESAPENLGQKFVHSYGQGDLSSTAEENTKPLLDSQAESDSQRDNRDAPSRPADIALKCAGDPNANDVHTETTTDAEDITQGTKLKVLLSPASFRQLSSQAALKHAERQKAKEKHKRVEDTEKTKRKIARAKERRATIVLGIIMATFILCWLPFFSTYLISSLTGYNTPDLVFAVFFWAGYCNSALNPVIYTIFNRDFGQAFYRLLCGRRRGRL